VLTSAMGIFKHTRIAKVNKLSEKVGPSPRCIIVKDRPCLLRTSEDLPAGRHGHGFQPWVKH